MSVRDIFLIGSFVALSFTGQVWSQQAASQNRYKVSGIVVNAVTGTPVGRALITATTMNSSGSASQSTFSGEDGRFELVDVAEGAARFAAQRPGFIPGRLSTASVSVTASTPEVRLKLDPESKVHGRVLNSDGEPVEGVVVQLINAGIINGRRVWSRTGSASTDENGNFLIENVRPGAHLVATRMHPVFGSFTNLVIDGKHLPEVYPPVYYPNVPDRASAQPIQVSPGADVEVNFTLNAVPGYKISGSFAGSRAAMIGCQTPDGDVVTQGLRRNPRTGEFSLSGIPSGSCKLVARSFEQRGRGGAYAEQMINITNADVTGVQLALQPLPEIPITVSGYEGNGQPPVNLQVTPLDQDATSSFGGPPHVEWFADGTSGHFTIQNVRPGTFRITAQGTGNTCVGSIQSGSADLSREPLTITAEGAPQPIRITLRTDCGTVTGTIEGAQIGSPSPQTAAPVWIIIVGGPTGAMSSFSPANNFTIPNLTPGDYELYAFDNASDLEYANPEVMKRYEAQRVTLNPGAKLTVQLKLQNSTGGTQ